jgi:phosphate transport system ATP-binding protein
MRTMSDTVPEDAMALVSPPITPTAGDVGRTDAAALALAATVAESAKKLIPTDAPTKLEMRDVAVWYGENRAVRDVNLVVPPNAVTAFIGPSGCGKSTILRCFNRMNDLIPGCRVEGEVLFDNESIQAADAQAVEVRQRIGLVFQKPNPFPMSMYENVAYGPRRHGVKERRTLDEIVERSLRRAALWDEVKDDFRKKSGLALSGGQQQRLCIARALAVRPDVLLMDEPCSALDPTSTRRVEETIRAVADEVTVVIVTHNMQQAQRVSDRCAFFLAAEGMPGHIVEQGDTVDVFERPRDERTADYVNGRFG